MAITKAAASGLANPRRHTTGGVTPWVRPADWVTLPTVNVGDQKLVGSYAVFNNDSNFVALLVQTSGAANYTVDWGDGTTPDSVASSAQANHNYVWANVNSGTLTSDGFRQAIITVTPNSGNLLQVILYKKHTQTNLQNGMTTGWLDIRMASSTLTTLTIGGATTVKHSLLRRFEYVGTSNLTTGAASGIFQNCRELVSVIGTAWTSGITDFTNFFASCLSLQTIPLLDTHAGANFTSMFNGCSSLQAVSLLNTAAGTNFTGMFSGCSALQTIPLLNTSAGTNFTNMFLGCYLLQTVPLLNTAAGITFLGMLSSCSSLQTIPLLNTVTGTSFSNMFAFSSALQAIPLLNTAAGTDFSSMLQGCTALQTVPLLDTHAGVTFTSMFQNDAALTTIPALDTAAGQTFTSMFNGCSALQTIPALNLGNGTTLTTMFSGCPSLISSSVTGTKVSISYASCQLSATDLNAIYTNLASGVTAKTITVSTNWGIASDDPTIATGKGWTVTGS